MIKSISMWVLIFWSAYQPLKASTEISREQICYLLRHQEVSRSIDLYCEKWLQTQKHDFELLEQLAIMILEEASHLADPEEQTAALMGLKIAGVSNAVDLLNLLEEAIKSNVVETALFAIEFLGMLQDDRSESLLTKAMHSIYLFIRMEAAHLLSLRRSPKASGQIEALMHRLPREFRPYFSNFFAMLGTSEATKILKQLLSDRDQSVRISALISCALFERDDLLLPIRSLASQNDPAQQEVSAWVLGLLKDSYSTPFLKKVSKHFIPSVRLAALQSLFFLGHQETSSQIIEEAKKKDLHAIAFLANIPESKEVLFSLLENEELNVRLGATLSLLKQKDPACIKGIKEILIKDSRGIGFQPHFSLGGALTTWKAQPSIKELSKELGYDGEGLSLAFREEVLTQCLELPEKNFLEIAELVFSSQQTELVPLLVSLLENLQTPSAKVLLAKQSLKAGAPLVRSYSNLALYRLQENGPYKTRLYEWIEKNKDIPLLRFRPITPRLPVLKHSSFELTPEETSRLFIEALEALANQHDENNIDMLLKLIKTKNSKNRSIYAGILLRALQ